MFLDIFQRDRWMSLLVIFGILTLIGKITLIPILKAKPNVS